jgi:Sec-independent protein translocase protein TatA
MFGFSMGEMLLLMAIALIAIGPKQLPEVARTLGKFMNELKRATGDFTKTFTDVRDDTRNTWDQARKGMNDVFTAGTQAYNETVRPAPEGTISTAPPPGTPGTHPITPDDPFGVGHNPHAHAESGDESDPQGSLFVPTDLSDVEGEKREPSEEQLTFTLTSFDDDQGEGHT